MRIYEELFIVKPDAAEEETDQLVEQLQQVIAGGGGAIDKLEKWGIRRLAYRVQKYDEGCYVLLQFRASPDTVKEIERRLRVADSVLKFLTVRIDQTLKRIEKRKKQREKRAVRKPSPAAAAAAPAPAPAPAHPVSEEMVEAGRAEEKE